MLLVAEAGAICSPAYGDALILEYTGRIVAAYARQIRVMRGLEPGTIAR